MLDITKYKHVHCIGIGGIGLSAVAEILKSQGYEVSGSDMKSGDTTERLQQQGITVYIGHDADNVKDADIVVYSSAVSPENPEILAGKEKGIPVVSRAEALGALMSEYGTSIAVSGTHGKTTTTSMVSLILEKAGTDPTVLIGGNVPEFHGNAKIGHSQYFVTEACEYMDSFLHLRPNIEIILNIDSDHLDYFKDIDHIVQSFDKFARLVPQGGFIVAYDANPFVSNIINSIKDERIITFGFSESSTYAARNIKFDSNGYPEFDVVKAGETLAHVHLRIPGEHNIANALAAFASCHTLGVDPAVITEVLAGFSGTQRRFDVIGTTSNGVKIIDDYAHHPTEIKATLKAAQNMPHKKIWCLFQPHTYTRTLALFDEFTKAFGDADVLCMAEIFAAREKNIYKISSRELIREIRKDQPEKEAFYFKTLEEIADFVGNNAMPGDIVITMGAGDIYKIADMLMKRDDQ
ncbi:MAG: UDP-N-acetylmuramate--L-alanine ligase [Anaerovoracaceae bacterium]|nr:UDP-N-acetylmuramate--L-alanine ligase [Bacillota bacterium]MDY2670614.1 UDP-N-acetylmuramate--L-alanine ligase [Anaerovoracaceae bacterium]